MNIHRQIGALFGWFCTILIGWHLLTPENPHHVANLILHSSLSVAFFASTMASVSVCRYLHPVALLAGASVVAWAGNFPVAALLSLVALLLNYSYGGFRTISTIKVAGSFIGLFVMFFLSILVSGYGPAPSYGHAFVWTAFSFGMFWLIWIIFQSFAFDIVQQNRDLLELAKRKTKGDCADVATKRG